MRYIIFGLLMQLCMVAKSQELFVYTEPASNMAAKSIGFRLNNTFMKVDGTQKYNYHFLPEIMFGISKHIMVHTEAFFSTRNNGLKAEGGLLYMKYRFYSEDAVHSHFRMAVFARGALNNSDIHQPAINLNGHNSGLETGFTATKLINKVALSAGVSHLYAADNSNGNKFYYGKKDRNAMGYHVSFGKLLLPKEYTSYNQTNVNGMLEVLGQTNLQSGKSYVDLAPSVQFIILSRMRLDIGYSFPVLKDLERTTSSGVMVRFEYNIFNAF